MKPRDHKLTRQTFIRARSLDFFTEAGLAAQIGYGVDYWPSVLLKELIDNALDACESADVVPTIKITLAENSLTVSDDGPGLPESTMISSLDYSMRVSDKINYISPTRGQLGNALKCIWALPFVVSGNGRGLVDVDALGIHHRIEITGSPQDPQIGRTSKKSAVKKGTIVKVTWPGLAGSEDGPEIPDFYKVVSQFALLNPHATFKLDGPDADGFFPPSAKDWRKWRTNDPTSPHWYSSESFQNLVMAYRANGQTGKSVREFVGEFDGLRGTQYQRRVIEQAGVSGTLGDLNEAGVIRLLKSMKEVTRPVQPQRLGVIGEEHFRKTLLALGISANSFKYKKQLGVEAGMPFVVEAAFGAKRQRGDVRDLIFGLNFSPTFRKPSLHLESALVDAWIDDDAPVVIAIHQVTPQLRFTSLGKGEVDEMDSVREALSSTVERVTRHYTKTKRRSLRTKDQQLKQEHLDELAGEREERRSEKEQIKAAAYQVMPESYDMVSGNGSLPANARQIMYAARKLVLAITGGKCWADSSYFTQMLLPDYLEEYAEETAAWNVVYDARGHFREPHTGVRFGIGTLEVRKYLKSWRSNSTRTCGPANRFRFALFIEKEGFDALIDASQITERFDISFLSTKGMSVTACRELIEELSIARVITLTAHDFDFSGFGIHHTLGHDTRRYKFRVEPNLIDIGLSLADVREMNLDPEPYVLRQEKDPKIRLREYGASPDEIDFLVRNQGRDAKGWHWNGMRVELNAMTSVQFIAWLERKLLENGVEKLVPDVELLGPIWQERQRLSAFEQFKITDGEQVRALEAQLEQAKAQLETDFGAQYKSPQTPNDLQDQVKEYLRANPLLPWDTAILEVADAKP